VYNAVDIWGADPAPHLRELLATTGYTKLTLFPGGFRAMHVVAEQPG